MQRRMLKFNTIFSSIVKLGGPQQEVDLLDESGLAESEARMTEVSETDLLNWIFSNSDKRQLLLENMLTPNIAYTVFREKSAPILKDDDKPGDIDILLVPENREHESIALEVKRVKAKITEEGNEVINKVDTAFKKGIHQANALCDKFHKTYLVLLIVTDGKNKQNVNPLFRGVNGDRIHELYSITFDESLNEKVGVVFVKITEPSVAEFNTMGYFGVCHDRSASPKEQLSEYTERIKKLVKSVS